MDCTLQKTAFLEKILLDDNGDIRARYREDDATIEGHAVTRQTLSMAEDVAPRVDERPPPADPTPEYYYTDNQKGSAPILHDEDRVTPNPLKRKHEVPIADSWLFPFEDVDIAQHLPSQPLLEKVADFFCISFHHWIPYIHKKRLQTRVRQGSQDPGLVLVLHALVAVALRHMDPEILFLDADQIQQQIRVSRMIVETHSMRNVTIESLQALIFLVFDLLNDGQTQRAWPLIGSLTRTIDYLQLTTEPTSSQSGSLMAPVRLVKPSSDWTELEERRRLFWIIFLLDRFCSVSTGWNTSLTADDVHRRLPADGGYFTREEIVTTPFFGIWNKAAARIGRSLANVPAQYNEDDPGSDLPQGASPNSANGYIDASKLGAFAYCVEATESLSQVTTFFLQQRINWQDKEHAVSWLTRFKELDLRLVQWKMFLPPRWKDSNISADRAVVDMDPNLTLAHITHNTSMILLHHPIGYPPRGWNDFVALPKECSAQTCELAAVETSNIVDKFLAHTPIPFVNVQFSFCAFIAAKALLFEHQATRRPLRSEFQRLVRDLWEMATRWRKRPDDQTKPTNQAGMYADHLERLQEACQNDPNFRFDFYDHNGLSLDPQHYSSPSYASTPQARSRSFAREKSLMRGHERNNSFNSSQATLSPRHVPPPETTRSTAIASPSGYIQHNGRLSSVQAPSPTAPSPLYQLSQVPSTPGYPNHAPPLYQMNTSHGPNSGPHLAPYNAIGTPTNQQSVQDQSLLNLSDAFMDSHFLDMDRVITFEDANFFLPGDAYRWQ
ncbi:fungal specific transcription factor [Stemphylium lycopersici]|uniref:Fungal specific transcription factor n=1 Tax=Stemphylium lycopersici TaxID=183478 RepID=A0A364NGV6_STELY|nr:fungal specific transcription factor [Stemphylium lycopersici]RAR09766.1 fungal specific transcription factor [Stemphylium lycopersici]RAR16519.1 fungal specific transcription factor [Stemphylium lycopersici]